jgi:tungstate transport system permease protein
MMSEFTQAFAAAGRLIATADADLFEIVALSLRVSLTAVAIAAVVGFPLGAALALMRFPGRRALTILLSALMGLPPVVVGLVVYLMLSRQVVEDLWHLYEAQLRSLGCSPRRAIATMLWETRYSLVTIFLAGFGRAGAEVGAVMIVGGNIDHVTRVMTTAIALETSRGELALALGLGLILLVLALVVNGAAFVCRDLSAGPARQGNALP